MNDSTTHQAFPLGRVVITTAAQEELDSADVSAALGRHARGDWGDLDRADIKQNEVALREGERLFSLYRDRHETRFYIITEADRRATTVLLPDDY